MLRGWPFEVISQPGTPSGRKGRPPQRDAPLGCVVFSNKRCSRRDLRVAPRCGGSPYFLPGKTKLPSFPPSPPPSTLPYAGRVGRLALWQRVPALGRLPGALGGGGAVDLNKSMLNPSSREVWLYGLARLCVPTPYKIIFSKNLFSHTNIFLKKSATQRSGGYIRKEDERVRQKGSPSGQSACWVPKPLSEPCFGAGPRSFRPAAACRFNKPSTNVGGGPLRVEQPSVGPAVWRRTALYGRAQVAVLCGSRRAPRFLPEKGMSKC